jgi:integrase
MQSNSTASPSTSKPAPTWNAGRQPGVKPPKPAKPYPDFPLYAHASGRWAKKIRGVLKYFGPWADPDGALANYLDRKNDLHAGRTPRADAGELTVKDLVNAFLNSKQNSVDAGELKQRTWNTYKETTDFMIGEFGKRRLVEDIGPSDFASMRRKMAKRWGLHRLANHIQYTRSVFKFGVEEGLIVKAVRYGTGFKKPSKKNFRIEKSKQELKLFTADEIRRMLAAATPSMKAMILLGVNCGFGNADCALLPTRAVDLHAGWINFPRPKTGLDRRCPLWPETVAAIKNWLPVRPAPKDDAHADLVFITAQGGCWLKETTDNPTSKEMAKLLKKLQINGNRNFYTLRHTHRTIGDAACDQRASGYIMGHVDPSMASHYVEHIADERLLRVTGTVRTWLFGVPVEAVQEQPRLKIAGITESA